jgi:predicted anti-sigma-YlaC factor YlaD
MTPSHPSANELLDHHTGAAEGVCEAWVSAHLELCASCRETIAEMEWLQSAMAELPEAAPPSDGFDRVLVRIGSSRPALPPAGLAGPVLGSLAAAAAGGYAIYAAAQRLAASPIMAALPLEAPMRLLTGVGLASLAFFAVGSLVTLALAPILILESRSRERWVTAR